MMEFPYGGHLSEKRNVIFLGGIRFILQYILLLSLLITYFIAPLVHVWVGILQEHNVSGVTISEAEHEEGRCAHYSLIGWDWNCTLGVRFACLCKGKAISDFHTNFHLRLHSEDVDNPSGLARGLGRWGVYSIVSQRRCSSYLDGVDPCRKVDGLE